jgi:hypothetical protein
MATDMKATRDVNIIVENKKAEENVVDFGDVSRATTYREIGRY